MAFQVLLAGQDITLRIDQKSIQIDDTLGQGSGAGSSGATQGRAATIKFNTDLGPMNTAIGAGQPITGGPKLVRQGEIKVLDASGTAIFGGFATKFTDTTTTTIGNTKQNFTTVEGIDYSTSLQRTLVNETFSAATDIQVITTIMKKYVGWVNLRYLPQNPAYTFEVKNFRNQSVEQVLQTVAGITGYLVFMDYNKYLHYISPTSVSSAPFNISDKPDFFSTFPHSVTSFVVDDTSAINRVFFYGGTSISQDFTQDISPLANGHNKIFPLAYYPSPSSTGKYQVTKNGAALVVGNTSGTAAADKLKSQGGTADVLIDPGSRTLTFDVAPATGVDLEATYRYSIPLSIVITDEKSHQFFGPTYLDGSIDDNTIFDRTTAIQRAKVMLTQQSYGLTTLQVDVYKGGIQSGMLVQIKNAVRAINATYLCQQVQIEHLGSGTFVYHLTLGAWNWNMIDFMLKMPTLATFMDDQQETQETVTIEQLLANVKVHDAWTKKTTTMGQYYARSTALGDGHDAYCGFATITT